MTFATMKTEVRLGLFLVLCGLLNAIPSRPTRADDARAVSAVPVVGLDADMKSVVKTIPLESYQRSLASAFAAVQDSLAVALSEGAQSAGDQERAAWRIQTIAVGVGVSGQMGLGPIWSVTASPRIRLVFTNSPSPIYPD